jgi:hypothetical protein
LPRRNKPEGAMAATTKQSARGRKQDRARVAGGQDYEIGYESRKTKASRAAVIKRLTAIRRFSRRRSTSPNGPQ